MPVGRETKSWFKSPEAKAAKKMQKDVTAAYLAGELKLDMTLEILCVCRSFHHPHTLAAHKRLRSEMDWRTPEERAHDSIQFWDKSA